MTLQQKTGRITPMILDMHRRLHALESMTLPNDDPRMMAHGEIGANDQQVRRHFGLRPWTDPSEFHAVGDMLAKAAGLERRADSGNCYDIT